MNTDQADPVLVELYRHRFTGIAEEIGVALQRTAYSPNIKERLDFSCAIFDVGGRLLAQAAHIPVHLGAMPDSVNAALAAVDEWSEGDLVVLNDPFAGGTHLPDITMISPVYVRNGRGSSQPQFFVASRAHHSDVGGMSPGSLPLSREIYQEGLIIPPVKLYRSGKPNEELLSLILRNVRTPAERRGDLAAQRSAHVTGTKRLQELVERHGAREVASSAEHLIAYSERLMREALRKWPDGRYSFEDFIVLDDREPLETATIRIRIEIAGDRVDFDFEGTDASVESSLNAVMSITRSACYYVAICLADETIPVNHGCFVPIRIMAPDGCLVNARPPCAVAGGNVETSQRIVDVVLGALASALPDRIPAASQGTMNNIMIGGVWKNGEPYTYYETIAGGMGAAPDADGLDGVHVHMTNTLNTPVEALEMAFPLRVETYALRHGSGGRGLRRGGSGLIREYRVLSPTTITVLSERRSRGPWGLAGGEDGAPGHNVLIGADGTVEELPSKFSRRFNSGDVLRIETPGGGGWGTASEDS